ncbi:MAG: hypothetical protein ACM3ZT_09600 [Bacillota bacterium]
MAGKKPVTATKFRRVHQARAKRAASDAKKRVQHYSKGEKLIKQVSKTLKQIAASHPHPKGKKQVKLAIKQLKQAHAAFGNAGMCADSGNTGGGGTSTTYNNS